jgi:ABC-type nitrate/sulfonate/bicarbonate transport system permease component
VGTAAVVVAVLVVWQAATAGGLIKPDALPSMSATVAALGRQLGTLSCWQAIGSTLAGWGIGLVIGGVAGIVVGTLIGLSPFAFRSSIPVIEFFKAVPVIAVLPLAVLLFGTTLRMKFVLVAFGVFWPLTIQVVYGIRSMDPVVRDTSAVLQVRGLRRLFLVVLPSAAPFIATGLRIGAATALILDIITELVGGGGGLGLQILKAENSGVGAFPIMYAFIVITGVVGVAITGCFTLAERRLLRWHESQRGRQVAA